MNYIVSVALRGDEMLDAVYTHHVAAGMNIATLLRDTAAPGDEFEITVLVEADDS